ncbi:MAG: hypothetical protein RIC19_19735 [Phaeodactylibacter sp.]|uniref:hypothetical protein n=1 Tax=Phaeodactylibacter sp. TaxID=1940289 RepID=UPI0032EC646B
MHRLSSNATLLLKFFIPVFWIVFFGVSTLVALFYQYDYVGNTPAIYFKAGMVFFYVTGVLLFAFTLLRLKRVEADGDFLYVTNYFKTARYPFHNVAHLRLSRFLFLQLATVHLHESGIFGKRFFFLGSRHLVEGYFVAYPERKAHLLDEGKEG